jgi:hypothetical protein
LAGAFCAAVVLIASNGARANTDTNFHIGVPQTLAAKFEP